MIHYICEWSL